MCNEKQGSEFLFYRRYFKKSVFQFVTFFMNQDRFISKVTDYGVGG
jgi:hypothetical protein